MTNTNPSPAEKLALSKSRKQKKTKLPAKAVLKCNLAEIRKELGLTQRDVADAVGLSAAGYNQIENRGSDLMLTSALKLSVFFQKPIPEIWEKL